MLFEIGATKVGYKYPAEIIECISRKEYTVMYRARLQWTEMPLMAKGVIHTKQIWIQKEYEILSRLRHPGIPRVLEFVKETEASFLLMPYYTGQTLEELVLQEGELPEKMVLDIAKQLCEILCYLQMREVAILHNDIKPANILLQEDGSVMLLDFGLACYEGEGKTHVLFQGSLGYAAPECWHLEECTLSKATDVFAFGATIYRLLTGEKPCSHYGKFLIGDVGVQERWQKLINKCCTLEAKYRYQNAAQIYDSLQSIQIK